MNTIEPELGVTRVHGFPFCMQLNTTPELRYGYDFPVSCMIYVTMPFCNGEFCRSLVLRRVSLKVNKKRLGMMLCGGTFSWETITYFYAVFKLVSPRPCTNILHVLKALLWCIVHTYFWKKISGWIVRTIAFRRIIRLCVQCVAHVDLCCDLQQRTTTTANPRTGIDVNHTKLLCGTILHFALGNCACDNVGV